MASSQRSSAAVLRQEVMSFRMVELQSVADRLGLRKTGRKGELQSRILQFFGELDPASSAVLGRSFSARGPQQQWKIEQAERVVHDTYRRMMNLPPVMNGSDQSDHSALLLAAGGSGSYFGAAAAAAAAAADAYAALYPQQHAAPPPPQQQQQQQVQAGVPASLAWPAKRVRCICNVQGERASMVMCQGRGCAVWQHCDCLGLAAPPANFLCELCRARLADPFWEVTEQVLPPSRLKPTPGRPPVVTSHGPQEVQCADRVFYLNAQQLEPAQRDPHNHRVQASCVYIGDEVQLRYHWPKHIDLRINSMSHRPYGRATNAKMGINQRDDVASIGAMVVKGRNSLALSAADSGLWILMLQLARRRTLDQVKGLMLAPESLEAAAARVRRHFAGGGDDSDDDLLVSQEVVSLKDPMSGQRMQVPARFVDASGLQPFDLDSFLSMAQRNRKWQDPTTLNNSSVEQLQVDSYMQRVLECLKGEPAVTDVEISAEGQWRPADRKCDWFDITAEPQTVAAALAAARAPSAAGGSASQAAAAAAAAGAAVKPEPGTSGAEAAGAAPSGAANGTANGTGNAAAEELVLDSDSGEEEDEAEELRKAAAAVRRASAGAIEALAGQKRKEPEVIDLLSSDDDEAPPQPSTASQQSARLPQSGAAAAAQPAQLTAVHQLQQRMAQQAQQAQQHASGGPLRIRLPARRPAPAAPAAGQPGAGSVGSPLAALSPVRSGGFQPASQLMPQLSGGAFGGTALPAAGMAPFQQPLMQPLMHGMSLPPGTLPVTGPTATYPPAMIPVAGMGVFQSMLAADQLAAIAGAQIQAAAAAADSAVAAAGQHVLPLVGTWPTGAVPAGAAAGSAAALQSQASSGHQQQQPGQQQQQQQQPGQQQQQQQRSSALQAQELPSQASQQAAQSQQQQQQQQQQRDPRVEQEAADLMRELAEEEMLAQLFADD